MSTVSSIEEKRGIVTVYADRKKLARIRKKHFDKLPVFIGDDIEPMEYIEAVGSVQLADAYDAALNSLEHSARSAKELSMSLLRRGYVQPAVDEVIVRLVENNLIDDRRLAERMAELSVDKPVGVYAVKRKLTMKGIEDDDIDEALEAFDPEQQLTAAMRAGEKLNTKYAKLPAREHRHKLSQALARRGFSWDTVNAAVDKLLGDDLSE